MVKKILSCIIGPDDVFKRAKALKKGLAPKAVKNVSQDDVMVSNIPYVYKFSRCMDFVV